MTEYEVGFYGRMFVKAENEEQALQRAYDWQMAATGGYWPELPDTEAAPVTIDLQIGEAGLAEEGRAFRNRVRLQAAGPSL
jgi:hypothetical protein